MLLIGLGHKARQGKNFTAKAMIQRAAESGLYAKEYALADALKAHCRVTYGMRQKDARLLQIVGTEVGRHCDPDLWVRVLMDTMEEQAPDVAIVTDVRYPNEIQMIEDRGGFLVKISRFNRDNTPWVAPDRDPLHASEIALDDYRGWHAEIKAFDGDQDKLRELAMQCFGVLWAYNQGGNVNVPDGVMVSL